MSRAEALVRDAAARLTAQQEFSRPLVIEAGAGTGKTATLVARIVVWSMGPGWAKAEKELRDFRAGGSPAEAAAGEVAPLVLGGVVAITFTEAAAAEMAERVGVAFAELAAGRLPLGVMAETVAEDTPERRERARELLTNLDRLTVATIHAYCRRLLTEQPIEAGLHPALEVDAEETVLEEVVHLVVEGALRRAYTAGDADALALAAEGFGPPEVAEALTVLAREGVDPAELAGDPFTAEWLEGITAGVHDAAAALAHALAGRFTDGRATNARSLAEALPQLARRASDAGRLGALEALRAAIAALLPDNLLKHLQKWSKDELNATESRELGPDAALVPSRAAALRAVVGLVGRLDPQRFNRARRLLAPQLAAVHAEMRRRGAITYQGLLAETRALLAGSEEVRSRLRRRIGQLLVDEFQDTDPLQCEIVAFLALDGEEGERPGLFIVGDPKQSIYGWRYADLASYEAFVRRVLAEGERPLQLTVNFRSLPAILAEVERITRPIMREEAGVQPAFEPLSPCEARREAAHTLPAEHTAVEHWVSWLRPAGDENGPATSSVQATDLEARALARDLRRAHDEDDVAWGDVGVLLRATTDLDRYLRALQEAGVPYAVERDRSYFQRREIIDAAALVRCVLDPSDHLALLTVLRSALVGVPDAALLPLWTRGFLDAVTAADGPSRDRLPELVALARSVAAALPMDIPGIDRVTGWEESLVAFLSTLGTLRASYLNDPPDLFVEMLRTATLVEATEAARTLGAFRVANLDRFFRRLLAELCGGGDAHAVLRMLRIAVAEARQAEEGRPREVAEDAVQVMTIHKAKGLDFSHVYAVELHKRTRGERRPAVEAVRHGGGWELVLLGAPSPGFVSVEDRRAKVEAAELVRTLYVAATRAKDRLVLAGRRPDEPVPGGSEKAKSHTDLLALREGSPGSLAALMEETGRGGSDRHRDEAGVWWVFPGLAETDAEPPSPPRRDSRPDPELARIDRERLAADAAEADRRMARPFRGAASDEAHRALERLLEDEPDRSPWMEESGAATATAVGSAVHRFLERFDLTAPREAETASRRAEAHRTLALLLPDARRDRAAPRLDAILDTLLGGALWRRLESLAGTILGRELAVLLPPVQDGPVGFTAGAVDLVYRDPEDASLVVADYKTDAVEPGPDLDARVDAYASQGRVYVRAIQQALGLTTPPRFELWFIAADRVVEPSL